LLDLPFEELHIARELWLADRPLEDETVSAHHLLSLSHRQRELYRSLIDDQLPLSNQEVP